MDAERKLIRERAAEWVCELQEATAEQHEAFAAWVRQSPRHIEEFLFAATAWRALDGAGSEDASETEQAIARAMALAGHEAANVVTLPPDNRAATPREKNPNRKTRPRWAIAAGLAVITTAITLGWWGSSMLGRGENYVTTAGEQRAVRLADGSVMHLNTASRANVHFSEQERSIELIEGEALFVVAQDKERPFRVTAGSTVVQAVGTQFNVRKRRGDTTVSVIEGRVRIVEAELTAGEEATVARSGRIEKRAKPEIADAIAWRERRLVFRGEALEAIAEEVNRYSPERRLRVEGAARDKRLAETFSADDPQALVKFLESYDDLSVDIRPEEVVIRKR